VQVARNSIKDDRARKEVEINEANHAISEIIREANHALREANRKLGMNDRMGNHELELFDMMDALNFKQ